MAGPGANNSFKIPLLTGNLTATDIILKPLEIREGYPHGVRFANTYVTQAPTLPEPTYPITISNTGVSSIINTSTINISTTIVNASLITVPSLIVGGLGFSATFGSSGIVNTQFFTANGTWTKPSGLTGNEQVFIMMWGGGGARGYQTYVYDVANNLSLQLDYGGSGGGCLITSQPVSTFSGTVSVTVGGGGTFTTGSAANGTHGGNSVFGSYTAYGGSAADVSSYQNHGAPGGTSNAYGGGAGGAGLLGMGIVFSGGIGPTPAYPSNGGFGGSPLGGTSSTIGPTGGAGTFGGGGNFGGTSIFGGGGAGYVDDGGSPFLPGGNSVFGGVGGGAFPNTALATSIFAYSGGLRLGAGGYYNYNTSAGVNGVRGEVRIWVIQ